ncbi:DNA primase [Candidatus Peribacteria bacterium RIFCSPLOWO2_12_FULL_55_15]|nr:MAG: DNA primase [Candidatus Peribacteria bacterium RIFCSPHIGHO2_01_FULL_54_22]OGJ63754.1 MAG: DNA primase [Candidatus Peribacteria bacterium RIFCSPHIGHO2_02_FULL_55_24]OGJ65260.1 MAG: DNA primase [Candidatus Peribacteria bacterium RIFCSPHIGHO2_12_FULL_54_10]OGJ68809.1 MAG: DNA primase [Candidatus Peribacteria bacterium RIFCSPLOWO2_02_FULL_55_36]OGJ69016.1 MAG: DNA primase [Candidatus Peribacteria bacterium RIFCSPLOWO2_01_FULL_54_110]OGJ70260.1 MAG: DNA primase [Candidatus Peribacteria bact
MDPVVEIKARLPIEDLVRGYCQLKKAGRGYKALCPFHQDKNPSLIVSPDKGIAYCFACQSGGDIFSFYQKIEGVDFPQAIRDLAERAGVVIEEHVPQVKRDEKERARACLEATEQYYQEQLRNTEHVQKYLQDRGVSTEEAKMFGVGYAPDSFGKTYEALLKMGCSRSEILAAGLGIQREISDERIGDRFRNRVMFPIEDSQGRIVGFGGRTLVDDAAKYMNSPDGPLYRKSSVLYGLHSAKEAIRAEGHVVIVEGYFDLLACRRVWRGNVVASCGTALTEEHARVIRRLTDLVVLCLDQDRAGREAAERAFCLLTQEGLCVHAVVLPEKDPADMALEHGQELAALLQTTGKPYMRCVYEEIQAEKSSDPLLRRRALQRILHLLGSIPSAVERLQEVRKAAIVLDTTPGALEQDLRAARQSDRAPLQIEEQPRVKQFTSIEVTLGLFLLYPDIFLMLLEIIPPDEGHALLLYEAMRRIPKGESWTVETIPLSPEVREWARVLMLYMEEQGLAGWSENVALREIRRNCRMANRETVRRKQQEITEQLLRARSEGNRQEEALLEVRYQEVLKLAKMAA